MKFVFNDFCFFNFQHRLGAANRRTSASWSFVLCCWISANMLLARLSAGTKSMCFGFVSAGQLSKHSHYYTFSTGSALPENRFRSTTFVLDWTIGNDGQRGRCHLEQCRSQDTVLHVSRSNVPAANDDAAYSSGCDRLTTRHLGIQRTIVRETNLATRTEKLYLVNQCQ